MGKNSKDNGLLQGFLEIEISELVAKKRQVLWLSPFKEGQKPKWKSFIKPKKPNNMTSLDALRFPIGKWKRPEDFDLVQALQNVLSIARLPQQLDEWVESSDEGAIEKTYRPDGWTAAQVINHLADSHMNAFVRSKLTMTEDKPSILPYMEALWAELPDGKTADVSASLSLINGLHARWVLFFESLEAEDWKRTYYHPESKADFALYEVASLYAWHSEHHYHHLLLIHNPS